MQFSLKSIILAIVLIAMICSFYFAIPLAFFAYFHTVIVVFTPILMIGLIVYGRDATRAFGIGGLSFVVVVIGRVLLQSFIGNYIDLFSPYSLKTNIALFMMLSLIHI